MNRIKPKIKVTIGFILNLLAIVGRGVPFTKSGASISQASRLCNSSLGQLGQTFSATARSNCQQAGLADNLLWIVTVVGLVLGALGLYQLRKKRQHNFADELLHTL